MLLGNSGVAGVAVASGVAVAYGVWLASGVAVFSSVGVGVIGFVISSRNSSLVRVLTGLSTVCVMADLVS